MKKETFKKILESVVRILEFIIAIVTGTQIDAML